MSTLLSVNNLIVDFKRTTGRTTVRAVDDVSFDVDEGETVGIVGESGSGKSTVARCILGLLEATSGSVSFDGVSVNTRLSHVEKAALSKKLQVVFQDPRSSLDPRWKVSRSIAEPLRATQRVTAAEARRISAQLLEQVGISASMVDRLPSQFSGGQRQRIAIARALVSSPKFIVCDEAVSALDLSTQAQILNLFVSLREDYGLGYLFIAHNLSVVRYMSHRIIVMYHGRVMESGPAHLVHDRPLHPYTQALSAAVPVPDTAQQTERRRVRLQATEAVVAGSGGSDAATMCPFAGRCPHVDDVCWTSRPAASRVGAVDVACHLFDRSSGHKESVALGNASMQR